MYSPKPGDNVIFANAQSPNDRLVYMVTRIGESSVSLITAAPGWSVVEDCEIETMIFAALAPVAIGGMFKE